MIGRRATLTAGREHFHVVNSREYLGEHRRDGMPLRIDHSHRSRTRRTPADSDEGRRVAGEHGHERYSQRGGDVLTCGVVPHIQRTGSNEGGEGCQGTITMNEGWAINVCTDASRQRTLTLIGAAVQIHCGTTFEKVAMIRSRGQVDYVGSGSKKAIGRSAAYA